MTDAAPPGARAGPTFPDAEGLADARRDYAARGWCRLRGFFGPSLLAEVDAGLSSGAFVPRSHGAFGSELCLAPSPLTDRLMHLMNEPSVLRRVEELTDAGHLGCFEGRIYRVAPGMGHRDDWHTDMVAGRMVALSINVGREPYLGGRLQLRRSATGQLLEEAENVGHGDALLFRLSHELEHRISDIAGATPKTAYAGWFRARPEFRDVMEGRANF